MWFAGSFLLRLQASSLTKLLVHQRLILRQFTASIISLDRDKYQHLWSEDFDSVYCTKMPKSKAYVSTDDSSSSGSDEAPKKKQKKEKTKDKEDKPESSKKVVNKADEAEPCWELGSNKQIKVREWKGKLYVDIREFYEKDGKLLPGKKGISLNMDQFDELMKVVHEVEDVTKIKRK